MNIWLDDTREAPTGFIHTKTAQDTIDLLKTGKVKSMSLDHDLGDDEKFGTGYDVARWVEQHAFNGTLAPLDITVHSANPVGAQKMRKAIESAERFWQRREKTANSLNKKFLKEAVGVKFYTVNEEAVRDSSLSHEEFTDFATHLDLPDLVPEGEVWLAENTDDRERRLHAVTALRLLRLVGSGLSKDEAYDKVLALEKAHREKLKNDEHWDESKRNTNTGGIRSKRLGVVNVCGHDISVELVNGDDVRDTFKTDFVEGGHGYVYPWIPEDEVWIEENLKEDERVPVLRHELYELGQMMNNVGYEEAHLRASQVEFEERQYKKANTQDKKLKPDKKVVQELFTAVVERDRDFEGIKELVERLGTADVTDSQDMTPLFAAVENDDDQMVELLLNLGANVNKESRYTHGTPLMHAAALSTPDTIRLLVKRGAKINKQNMSGETVLVHAIFDNDPLDVEKSDSFEMIKTLLSLGADPNTGDTFYNRPMSVAIRNDNFQVFKELVKHGGKVTEVERENKNWESFSDHLQERDPRFYTRLKVAKTLFSEYNQQREVDYVELLTGAHKNDLNRVKKVLERGSVDANLIERTKHQNALFMATDPEIVRYLLERGADPNLVDTDKKTPLFFQVAHGSPETIELLVKHGADVNHRDLKDMTPLIYLMFVSGVSLKKTKKLLDLGADVNVIDRSFGQNALFFSVYFNAPVEVVTLLLKHGAVVSERTRKLEKWQRVREEIDPRVMTRVREH